MQQIYMRTPMPECGFNKNDNFIDYIGNYMYFL